MNSDTPTKRELRILFMYTSAASEYLTHNPSGPGYTSMNAYINSALIYTLNETFTNSQINIEPIFACSFNLSGFIEGTDPAADLNTLFTTAIYHNKVNTYRDAYSADMCILLELKSSSTSITGATYGLRDHVKKNNEPYAYAVVDCRNATSTYSLSHEIGHMFGANHDRLNTEVNALFSYGYGFVNTSPIFRTIMSYGKFRVNYFSNPDVSYLGIPTGKCGETDNAAVISQTAPWVTLYRETELEQKVSLNGWITLESPGTDPQKNAYGYLVAGQIIKLQPPFYVKRGCGFRAHIGPCKWVMQVPPGGGLGSRPGNTQNNSSLLNNEFDKIKISPNPFNNILHITGIPIPSNIYLYSMYGSVISVNKNCSDQLDLSLSSIEIGTYFLKIISGQSTKNFKLIKSN